jgi:hypothetical protein
MFTNADATTDVFKKSGASSTHEKSDKKLLSNGTARIDEVCKSLILSSANIWCHSSAKYVHEKRRQQ